MCLCACVYMNLSSCLTATFICILYLCQWPIYCLIDKHRWNDVELCSNWHVELAHHTWGTLCCWSELVLWQLMVTMQRNAADFLPERKFSTLLCSVRSQFMCDSITMWGASTIMFSKRKKKIPKKKVCDTQWDTQQISCRQKQSYQLSWLLCPNMEKMARDSYW